MTQKNKSSSFSESDSTESKKKNKPPPSEKAHSKTEIEALEAMMKKKKRDVPSENNIENPDTTDENEAPNS